MSPAKPTYASGSPGSSRLRRSSSPPIGTIFDRSSHQPRATKKELRSDAVKHSALKSIAGFLTTGGGTLYIGVRDAGEVLGLRPDLELLQGRRRNVDQLINNIKTDVADSFRDGNTVNDYVSIEAVDVGDAQVLQLEVASRRKLSFLASGERNHQLFRRQGNRTNVVEIYELEEFQAWRNEHIFPSSLSPGPSDLPVWTMEDQIHPHSAWG